MTAEQWHHFRRGDLVTITTETGRTIEALITLASANGRSLALTFDAMIGGWTGGMAAFRDDAGAWSAIDGMPITITPRALGKD